MEALTNVPPRIEHGFTYSVRLGIMLDTSIRTSKSREFSNECFSYMGCYP
jgi:hypothetical protein